MGPSQTAARRALAWKALFEEVPLARLDRRRDALRDECRGQIVEHTRAACASQRRKTALLRGSAVRFRRTASMRFDDFLSHPCIANLGFRILFVHFNGRCDAIVPVRAAS